MSVTSPWGRDEVRAAIIDSASRLMAERGPSVSTREIAAAAGVNRGLLHRHVGSKETLIAEVLASGAERFAQSVDSSSAGSVGELVAAMFTGGEDAEQLTRLIAWLLLDDGGTVALGDTPPLVRRIQELMSEHAGAAADTTPEMATAMLLAMLMGWQLFAPALLPMVGIDRDSLTAQRELESIAELLASRVTGPTP